MEKTNHDSLGSSLILFMSHLKLVKEAINNGPVKDKLKFRRCIDGCI